MDDILAMGGFAGLPGRRHINSQDFLLGVVLRLKAVG